MAGRRGQREREREMSSEGPDLVCEVDNVQGIVDALTAVRWKRQQDAVVELSEHGVVLIVEESSCLQAKVYLQREVLSTIKCFKLNYCDS